MKQLDFRLHIPNVDKIPGGLWIPASSSTEKIDRHDLKFILVHICYSDLFGHKANLSDVVKKIRCYNIAQILNAATMISVALEKYGYDEIIKGQNVICRGLFGSEYNKIITAVNNWLSERKEKSVDSFVLYHELQVVNLVKIALLNLPLLSTKRTDSLVPLGEALLMVNDLLNEDYEFLLKEKDSDHEITMKNWNRYFTVNGYFHRSDNFQHALARSFNLYLTDHYKLRNESSYIDFPNLIEELTSIPADLLWTVLFSFSAHWQTIKKNEIHNTPGAINLKSYFTKNLKVSKEESDLFFSLVAENYEILSQKLIESFASDGGLNAYNILPFEDKPLIIYEDNVYCPCLTLLMRKITDGLHYLFLNLIESKSKRDQYLTFMGKVFEAYVDELFTRIYPSLSERYVDGITLKAKAPENVKTCDGLLIYPETLIMIETKASLMPLKVRINADWKVYTKKIDEIFLTGSKQIDQTISLIEAGLYKNIGLIPSQIKCYVPIIVTLEPTSLNPIFFKYLDDVLNRDFTLSKANIKPFQIIDISNLEFFEVLSEGGINICELLIEKVSQEDTRHLSVINYCYLKNIEVVKSGVNPFLHDQFEMLSNMALDIIRSRSKT